MAMKNLIEKMMSEDWKTNVAAGLLGASLVASPSMAATQTQQSTHSSIDNNNIVARVIAGEAAGEGYNGMLAVACVIQNRGGNPVKVVTKPKQFSAYADKDLMDRNYKQVKKSADEIASRIGKITDVTGGATNYVTKDLYNRKKNNPNSWISKMRVTKEIGRHVFMKDK